MQGRRLAVAIAPQLPEDVLAAIEAVPAARRRLDALPPSHVAEYLKWIVEARKAPTRERRIQSMVDRLAAEGAKL